MNEKKVDVLTLCLALYVFIHAMVLPTIEQIELKMIGEIDSSWLWVFYRVWLPIIGCIIIYIIMYFVDKYKQKGESKCL